MTIFEAAMTAEGAEGYEADDEEILREAWQLLIDTNTVWHLQGTFGRQAVDLIACGFCAPPEGAVYDEKMGRLTRIPN